MVCPVCKMIAGIDSNRVVGETDTKIFHKVTYLCRNPHCIKYKQVCATREYEEDKPEPVPNTDDTPETPAES